MLTLCAWQSTTLAQQTTFQLDFNFAAFKLSNYKNLWQMWQQVRQQSSRKHDDHKAISKAPFCLENSNVSLAEILTVKVSENSLLTITAHNHEDDILISKMSNFGRLSKWKCWHTIITFQTWTCTLVRMMFALVTTSQDFSQSFHIKSYNLSSQLSYLTVAYVFP